MKKLLTAILCLLATVCNFAQTYDKEVVCTDLKVYQNEDFYQFRGNDNEHNLIELNLFATEYGEYTAQEVEGQMIYPISGVFGRYMCQGEGVYSFSEEHNSDMLVATLIVPEKEWLVKVTMYGKSIIPTDTLIVENVSKTTRGRGDLQQLVITGTHEVYGDVTFTIYHYNTMNTTFPTIMATIQSEDYQGEGTWKKLNDQEVLEAIFFNEDASKIFKVTAYTKTAPSIPSTLDNVATHQAPQKILKNGQLIIIRNGVKFNANGTIID